MVDYDPHDWSSHLLDMRGSLILQICYRVMLCGAWAVAVVCFHKWVHEVDVSDKTHMLIGLALGLLLVFRTNASYDRFWEGRKQWGSIINETRNLGRQTKVLLAHVPDLQAEVLRWTIAFPVSAMNSLRGAKGLGAMDVELPKDKVDATLSAPNVPFAVALRMTELLQEARQREALSDYSRMMVDQNVQLLVDCMGACERIHRTPLPFVYVVHLRRALIVYCFTLPFALLREFGWLTIAATLLVSFVLYGIEEIGVEIEDPFGFDENDLPLERFCQTIDRDLQELLPKPGK